MLAPCAAAGASASAARLPPHVYAVAARAYRDLLAERQDQAILVGSEGVARWEGRSC